MLAFSSNLDDNRDLYMALHNEPWLLFFPAGGGTWIDLSLRNMVMAEPPTTYTPVRALELCTSRF